ncbi:MAG TPA: hypothetical protein V6C81_27280 [Planktothrix sp.]
MSKIRVVLEPGSAQANLIQEIKAQIPGLEIEVVTADNLEGNGPHTVDFDGQKIGPEGTFFRQGGEWVFRLQNASRRFGKDKEMPERVLCLNPEKAVEEQIIEFRFRKNMIYTQEQRQEAVRAKFAERNCMVVGPTGYSDAKAALHHLQNLDYEYAVKGIFSQMVRSLKARIRGLQFGLTNGSSDLGVDMAINLLAEEESIPLLGFSCPEFMLYVKDTGMSIVVCKNQTEYSKNFVETPDVLIALNGRRQAFDMDILGMIGHYKPVIMLDLMRALAGVSKGASLGPNGSVEDAVGLFLSLLKVPPEEIYTGSNQIGRVAQWTAAEMVHLAQASLKIDPHRKYDNLTAMAVAQQVF